MTEPHKGRRQCRAVEIDGETVHVYGDSEMDEESLRHFAEVVRAAKRKMAADQLAIDPVPIAEAAGIEVRVIKP